MESLLIDVHCEKGYNGYFNATRTCRSLTDAQKGTIEHILFKAGKKTLERCKDGELSKTSDGSIPDMYVHIYKKRHNTQRKAKKLSNTIHKEKHYDEHVKRMISGVIITVEHG